MKNSTDSCDDVASAAGGILILHATAGAGHTRAAQAIGAALKARGEAFQLVDILDCTPALFRRMYVKSYIDLVQKAPELWGYLYDRTDVVRPATSKRVKARLAFNQLNSQPFKKLLKEAAPRAIVCTHFLPLELLSDLKGRGKIDVPVHAVVTDVSPHALWVYPNIDCYHVATASAARELVRKGFPEDRIRVTGIPVDPVFAERMAALAARRKLGLPERPTVLLLSGGFGVGPMVEALESFRGSCADISLVVVAGKNAELEKKCREVAKTLPVPADLIVTKPGGLTTTEVLAKGKPMALVSPIPGQEQRNCEYLLEAGAAVRLYDVGDAAFYLTGWLADTERMKRMTAAARAIARPRAANEIAAAAVEGVG
jgi:processive 1,2-diacylglycerol beta-glucosyltransferase